MRLIPSTAVTDGSATLASGFYIDKNGNPQTSAAGTLRLYYDPADLKAPPRVMLAAGDSVGPGVLSASTLTEDSPALWSAGTTYAKGDRVRRPDHRIYENLIPGTDAATPESYKGNDTPRWFKVSPTNRYAPFDYAQDTQAKGPEAFAYLLNPNTVCTDIAIFNMDCKSVRVQVFVNGETKYDRAFETRKRVARNWTEWFYNPVTRARGLALSDLPLYRNALIAITFSQPGGTPAVGEIVIGRGREIGDVDNRPTIRSADYSSVETNKYGVTDFVKGRNTLVLDVDFFVNNGAHDEIVRLLRQYQSVPAAWIIDERFESMQSLGFLQEWSNVLDINTGTYFNAQIQGIVQV